jgi:sugar-phosphatase
VAPHLDAVQQAHEKEDIEADDTDTLKAFPGASRLISELPAGRWAIATSGKHRTASIRLNHCQLAVPEVFVTANDITRGKPDPEPYLLAMKQLGFPGHECVVIEDAPSGIKSARAAGAKVIAVTTTNRPEALRDADVVLQSLDAIQLDVVKGELRLSWDQSAEQ